MSDKHMQLTRSQRSGGLGQAGFTLTELMVASLLGLVVVGNFVAFNRFQLFALRNQANQLDIQTDARNLADLFAREIRRAGTNPTCAAGISAIAAAGTYQIEIQADLNGNGVIDGNNNEDVTYQYSPDANTVERIANGTTETLLSGVNLTGSRLRYFNAAGAELIPASLTLLPSQRAAVTRVRLELALSGGAVDPTNHLPLRARVASDVDLRNRFFIGTMPCPSP
jgi:prepilin-type N-terminal cleavage/methylation domain-containing protein